MGQSVFRPFLIIYILLCSGLRLFFSIRKKMYWAVAVLRMFCFPLRRASSAKQKPLAECWVYTIVVGSQIDINPFRLM